MPMKKRNVVITTAVIALILAAVLAGVAACQNPVTGIDLGGETYTLNIGPIIGGGYGGGPTPTPSVSYPVFTFAMYPNMNGYTYCGSFIFDMYMVDASPTMTGTGRIA